MVKVADLRSLLCELCIMVDFLWQYVEGQFQEDYIPTLGSLIFLFGFPHFFVRYL